MMSEKFYPTAVPLVTVDPYFNIWSCADHLYDDVPRHWTGRKNAMTGLLQIDGKWKRFMGRIEQSLENYFAEPDVLPQTDLEVRPMHTLYRFEDEKVSLELTFFTPLLLDDWKIMSRPVSYVLYEIKSKDGCAHELSLYFDICTEAAVDDTRQRVVFKKGDDSVYCGNERQNVLNKSGDDTRIDWGWLHLAAPGHEYVIWDTDTKKMLLGRVDEKAHKSPDSLPDGLERIGGIPCEVRENYPSLGCYRKAELQADGLIKGKICLAYDDIHSLEYFGKTVDAYWKKDGETFENILQKAVDDCEAVRERAVSFEERLKKDAEETGSEYYMLLSLAYRQVIAAHKLTFDGDEIQFMSKECFSNGCIGTVDITYPSIPLFLKYCPEILEGMLEPVFKYAASEDWRYPFAPHDVGQYPLANGQVYGYRKNTRVMALEDQMPVEECGNMLLCAAAMCKWREDYSYAKKHEKQLASWADYLKSAGWNPDNQLCTDDFAGHLAHNCNLSVKSILGLASWGKMLEKLGRGNESREYLDTAREWAVKWKEEAFAGDHYKLTFDDENSWSLKYNLIWDKLLHLHVFDEDVAKTEVEFYKKETGIHGIALDSRTDYTKSDWQMWTTVLTDDDEYCRKVIEGMINAQKDMKERTPFPDWYYTEPVKKCYFQNRTVQGGLFIRLIRS